MKYSIILLLFLLPALAPAQRTCATVEHQKWLEKRFPELLENQKRIEEHTQQYNRSFLPSSAITIPVVVHVVFANAAENISDEQIYSQIEVLNEDFRKLNLDVVNVPGAFAPVVADATIQFCLASEDPAGNPHSGINRVLTTHGPFIDNDDMKFAITGGIDAWNVNKYLNLWVCNLAGTLLGYAQFPGGPANTDGVVIDFDNVGYIGTVQANFDLGRTATHEIGHWLNLKHIWGDAVCGDDLVADTPEAEGSNGGCPTFPHNTDSPCGNPDGEMFMNYMDYVHDYCMIMFTQGQRDRMLSLFSIGGAREDLLLSTGCAGTCPRTRFFTVDFNMETGTFEASDLIIGWNAITNASDIIYTAGDSVILEPGFHAISGNDFKATIAGCSGTLTSGAVSQSLARNGLMEQALIDRNTQDNARNAGKTAVKLFPNPSGGQFRLEVDKPDEQALIFQLFSPVGETVYHQALEGPAGPVSATISLERSIPPGFYHYLLWSEDGVLVAAGKVVIQN